MKLLCELNDEVILGKPGRSSAAPRLTARAIVKTPDDRYALMYSGKWNIYTLPGGGVEDGENVLTALRREILEETGCVCTGVEELGIVAENRFSLDYTQINYYYVVTVAGPSGANYLTQAEKENRTSVQWLSFDEMKRLITGQTFERVQGKYLQARDIAALGEYTTWGI